MVGCGVGGEATPDAGTDQGGDQHGHRADGEGGEAPPRWRRRRARRGAPGLVATRPAGRRGRGWRSPPGGRPALAGPGRIASPGNRSPRRPGARSPRRTTGRGRPGARSPRRAAGRARSSAGSPRRTTSRSRPGARSPRRAAGRARSGVSSPCGTASSARSRRRTTSRSRPTARSPGGTGAGGWGGGARPGGVAAARGRPLVLPRSLGRTHWPAFHAAALGAHWPGVSPPGAPTVEPRSARDRPVPEWTGPSVRAA